MSNENSKEKGIYSILKNNEQSKKRRNDQLELESETNSDKTANSDLPKSKKIKRTRRKKVPQLKWLPYELWEYILFLVIWDPAFRVGKPTAFLAFVNAKSVQFYIGAWIRYLGGLRYKDLLWAWENMCQKDVYPHYMEISFVNLKTPNCLFGFNFELCTRHVSVNCLDKVHNSYNICNIKENAVENRIGYTVIDTNTIVFSVHCSSIPPVVDIYDHTLISYAYEKNCLVFVNYHKDGIWMYLKNIHEGTLHNIRIKGMCDLFKNIFPITRKKIHQTLPYGISVIWRTMYFIKIQHFATSKIFFLRFIEKPEKFNNLCDFYENSLVDSFKEELFKKYKQAKQY